MYEHIPYSKKSLYTPGKQRTFTGGALREIAFPLGGIGTGTVSLGGRGNLRDWEIYNRPNKGSVLDYTFFALWTKPGKGEAITRILESELQPPFNPGHGLSPARFSGVRRLRSATFCGEYPFACIDFEDDELPVMITLEAFNPLIPLNVEDSSIPVAILQWKVTNPSSRPVDITLVGTLQNPVGFQLQENEQPSPDGFQQNEYREEESLRGLYFSSTRFSTSGCNTGTATLSTSHPNVSAQTQWHVGGWWDAAHLFWDKFAATGQLTTQTQTAQIRQGPTQASLALHATILARKSVVLPVFITWHTPHIKNSWSRQAVLDTYMKRQFRDAWHVAQYTAANFERLRTESLQWHDAVFTSSLPPFVIDAITSQASTIRTQTCLRLADGGFYAYEGCSDTDGCCAGNCIHVWNYEQALAFLFPSLERSMRRTDFSNVQSNGCLPFRTGLPRTAAPVNDFPCADGSMGTIIQAYRDWQLSGEDQFLRDLWPNLKRALEYAWTGPSPDAKRAGAEVGKNQGVWDPNKDGVMEGVQHNTYDIEFYGPNTMMGTLYLGALRAAEKMATYLGETDKAAEYRQIFEKGRVRTDAELWNGEYYIQKVEVAPGEIVPEHLKTPAVNSGDCHGSSCPCNDVEKTPVLMADSVIPKYQYGDGCLSDQLLGQWACHVAGLGYVLDPGRVHNTVASIFRYNWKPRMDCFDSVQRVYALNDEAGLLLCTWPKGNRPTLPFVYCDEVWTGIEYQVAAHLIYEGLIDEGLATVKGVRDRHDGERRNPWNEFECGHHYARAMSSWSLLLALSGYHYSAVTKSLAFAPKINARAFHCAFTTGSAWGEFAQKFGNNALIAQVAVRYGRQELNQMKLTWPTAAVPRLLKTEAHVGRRGLEIMQRISGTEITVTFCPPLQLDRGEVLKLRLSRA